MMDCFAGEIIAVTMDDNMKKELCISRLLRKFLFHLMDDNMKKELCIRALKEAYELRKPADGLIHHSDAGSQYTSEAYKSGLASRHAMHEHERG